MRRGVASGSLPVFLDTVVRRLGPLDAIHLATADPLLPELTGLMTYDAELAAASTEIGIAVVAPR